MKKTLMMCCGLMFAPMVSADSILPLEVKAQIDAGAWLVDWQQQSNAASRFGADAIITDYQIDNAMAQAFRFDISLGYVSTNFEYAHAEVVGDKALTAISAGLGFVLDDIKLSTNFSKGVFKGNLSGVKNTDGVSEFGAGTFATDLVVADLILYYKKFGLGVRHYHYELPQDLYLVERSEPNKVALGISGFADIAYTGQFVTLAYDSREPVTSDEVSNNFQILLVGGLGRMMPSGDFLDSLNNAIRSYNNNQDVMAEGEAWFVESQLGYVWHTKQLGFKWGAELGYRYNKLVARFPAKANYALVSDFTTELSGPYLKVVGVF